MKFFTLITSAILLASSCNGDDPSPVQYTNNWNLINVSGGFGGFDSDFEPGSITWSFNNDNSTITVVNNNTDQTAEDFFDSGNYSFTIAADENLCPQFLTANEMEIGCIDLSNEGETMVIKQLHIADGFTLTFKKS
ncbi:hypothetical protein [Flavobacterium rhizosphaerae]|uniref:Lipocalin-like domain-containing protein n=1 Tax=Flavobacterium rhizosphaerae TaxID=3163298 RepID=A0ABW8YWN9_9FLAO